MSNEMATAPGRDTFPQEHIYSIIENRTHITETIRQLISTGSTQIALVSIRLVYKNTEKRARTKFLLTEPVDESNLYLLQHLRTLVRKTDQVFLHQYTMYFVLPEANLQGALIVEERLWEALLWRTHNMSEQKMARPFSMTIGHSAYPGPQTRPEALLTAADEISKRFDEQAERASPQGRGSRKIVAEEPETSEELPQLARKLGIPYLSLLPHQLPQRVQQVVDVKLAHELHCYPVGRERNTLTVAMRDPQDHRALERLRQETGLRIFPVLAHPEALENALKHLS